MPLYEETTAEIDNSFRNDYFQLGAKVGKQRFEIKGSEAEEGYLDFDQNEIIISGVDHELNVGDLLGFEWHETSHGACNHITSIRSRNYQLMA